MSPATPPARPRRALPIVAERPLVLGIDMRSGPRYPTGVAVLDATRRTHHLATVRTDGEIDALIDAVAPDLVAIDAPLALPEGRCCAEPACACARHGIMRDVDRLAARAGYRPFPALLPSMAGLTLRGIALRERWQRAGMPVIECYPGMTQDILGIPRKRGGVDALRRGLKRHGVRGLPRRRISHDELDAVTCALTGLIHLSGQSEIMGGGDPAPLILPDRTRDWTATRSIPRLDGSGRTGAREPGGENIPRSC